MSDILWNCPPIPYLKQVAKYAPTALWTYMLLWDYKDEKNKVILFHSEIPRTMLVTKIKFFEDILKLCSESLLNIDEKIQDKKKIVCIELVGWGNESED